MYKKTKQNKLWVYNKISQVATKKLEAENKTKNQEVTISIVNWKAFFKNRCIK